MSKEINHINKFNLLLNKYKFITPIPENIQKLTPLIQKRILFKTLKNTGELSLFYKLVLFIMFFLLHSGLKISVVKCKIIAAIICSILIPTIVGSSYIATKTIVNIITEKKSKIKKATYLNNVNQYEEMIKNTHDKNYYIKDQQENINIVKTSRIKKIKYVNLEHSIYLRYLKTNKKFETKNVSQKLFDELKVIAGNKIQFFNVNKRINDNDRLIVGSVWFNDGMYNISVKLINATDSKILFASHESYSPQKEKEILQKIAKLIIKNTK